MGFLVRLLIGAAGLWLADNVLPGLSFTSAVSLIIAVLLLGLANAIVRPIFFILTLPLTIVTLGLFIFVVNGAMVGLVSWLLPGMVVDNLWTAILAAIIVGLTGWVASWFVGSTTAVPPAD